MSVNEVVTTKEVTVEENGRKSDQRREFKKDNESRKNRIS